MIRRSRFRLGGGPSTRLSFRARVSWSWAIFELDKYDERLHEGTPVSPESPYAPVRNIRRMSLLFWAEHCVECAAPDCYQTCDLYQPRIDKRCRRFTYGAMKNRRFPSLRGYGVEISFKKWAKLQANGNLYLLPAKAVLWGERLVQWGAPIGNFAGEIMEKITGKLRWRSATLVALEELVRRLSNLKNVSHQPDAFLLEIYNPGAVVRMQLSFVPFPPQAPPKNPATAWAPSYVTTVDIPTGYSRHQVEFSLLRFVAESGLPFLVSIVPEADGNPRLVFLTADFVQFSGMPETVHESRQIKCVVWDLDNTLWNGTLAEGDDVVPRPEVVSLLKRLDQRGILLSIASKNEYAAAFRKLQDCGISEYFVSPQINWLPKSQNIRAIAERLNIGLDTFAFVDDSPFELAEVARALPGVVCVNAAESATLGSDPRFRGGTSADARRRRQFYQEAETRDQAREEFGSDYLGFLAACEITLEIAPYAPEESSRVSELVQRTNQLNLSGRKYTRGELETVLSSAPIEKLVLRSSDRFGSYGTVGFALIEQVAGTIRVLDFMLSCRVQGKLLERAFFAHLFEHHNPAGSERLWVNFQETARNRPARQALESLGFRRCPSLAGGASAGMLRSSRESLRCDFIQVRCLAGTPVARVDSSLTEARHSDGVMLGTTSRR